MLLVCRILSTSLPPSTFFEFPKWVSLLWLNLECCTFLIGMPLEVNHHLSLHWHSHVCLKLPARPVTECQTQNLTLLRTGQKQGWLHMQQVPKGSSSLPSSRLSQSPSPNTGEGLAIRLSWDFQQSGSSTLTHTPLFIKPLPDRPALCTHSVQARSVRAARTRAISPEEKSKEALLCSKARLVNTHFPYTGFFGIHGTLGTGSHHLHCIVRKGRIREVT